MKRTYGKIVFCHGGAEPEWHWKIEAEPQILITLKNVFPRVMKDCRGAVTVKHTDEVCRNIEWFMMRYEFSIDAKSLKVLKAGARKHRDTILRLEEIIDPNYKPKAIPLAIPARDYQRQAAEIFLRRGGLLIADDVGLGKTVTALAALADKRTLPAVVVTLAGRMPQQWESHCRRFLPSAVVHIINKGQPYELPKLMGRGPDIIILNYHKLANWANVLANYIRTVVYDECQELRRTESQKYDGAVRVSEAARFRCGLSATPIFNYGGEIWNVIDVLLPGILGTYQEFTREWCSGYSRSYKIDDPKAFGAYAKENFIILRRTRSQVGRELPPLTKIPYPIDSDEKPLEDIEDAAAQLAKIILSGRDLEQGDRMRASGELDWKVRHATGVAKAPHVASFVRILVENGERVVVYAWHRSVYDILNARLAEYKPANYTGEESEKQKNESFTRFTEGETPILLISLRAGQGVDGLQHGCRTVVFAELDWSPGVHSQCIGRVYRDMQKDPVTAYFLISDTGSDPVVAEALGLKTEQIEGINDPDHDLVENLQSNSGRAESLARHFLKERGLDIPSKTADVANTL
jgi:SNF2 family DNA or RNA helicase